MPVEFIGSIGSYWRGSEIEPALQGDIQLDPNYYVEFARIQEEGGFDRVLIGYGTSGPDNFAIAGHVAQHTERLGFLLAHRPGFISPTLAARKLATLEQVTNGRLAVHIITGRDEELLADGDFTPHDDRYRRTDEYLQIARKSWTSDEPFDFEGEFYRVKGAYSAVKPIQQPHIPLYFGGSSDIAKRVGAKHANAWALWGEPVEAVREQAAEVRSLAAEHGRTLGISVSLRPILGPTEEKAWERAYGFLERAKAVRGSRPARVPSNRGSQRLLEFAATGDVLDRRLFTGLAKVNGAAGNSTALVGTPEQVAESLLEYIDAGATTLLIRGYEPFDDARAYGRDLIPLVRAELKKREREGALAAAGS